MSGKLASRICAACEQRASTLPVAPYRARLWCSTRERCPGRLCKCDLLRPGVGQQGLAVVGELDLADPERRAGLEGLAARCRQQYVPVLLLPGAGVLGPAPARCDAALRDLYGQEQFVLHWARAGGAARAQLMPACAECCDTVKIKRLHTTAGASAGVPSNVSSGWPGAVDAATSTRAANASPVSSMSAAIRAQRLAGDRDIAGLMVPSQSVMIRRLLVPRPYPLPHPAGRYLRVRRGRPDAGSGEDRDAWSFGRGDRRHRSAGAGTHRRRPATHAAPHVRMPALPLSKSSSVVATAQTPPSGYFQQPSVTRSEPPTLLVWNATSHADPHSHGCPSAPAMQHSGGADVTVALHR